MCSLCVCKGTLITQMLRMTAVFSFYFFVIYPPFVISTRRAKLLIRGHLHHPRHLRAIKTSFCKEENIVLRPIKRRFLRFVMQRYNIPSAHCPPMSANVRQCPPTFSIVCKCGNYSLYLYTNKRNKITITKS